jgi:hypothetical protein
VILLWIGSIGRSVGGSVGRWEAHPLFLDDKVRSTRVVLGVLQEPQEEVADAQPKRLHALGRAAAVQQVGLSVYQLHDLLRQRGLQLLHRPLIIDRGGGSGGGSGSSGVGGG